MTHHQLAVISLTGSFFDVTGALYLAYDILGGKHGPLRTLTRGVTYGLLFGGGYGLTFGIPFGIAAGITHGLTLSLELRRASLGLPPYRYRYELLFSAIRGVGYAIGATYIHGMMYGTVFGCMTVVGQGFAYRIGNRPEVMISQSRHPRMTRRNAFALASRVFGYAIAGYASALIAHHQMHATMLGEQAGLAIGLVTALVWAVTPYVEWVAETMADRRMGVLGIGLILIGFALQSVQYWVSLLDIPVT